MATLGQIKGMLLEEVVLYLLRDSGYSVVEKIDKNDSTIKAGKAGLELLGRGGVHQIDAIADFALSHPFSNPQRLLVEAKCLNKPVGLPVVRNAIGVLKDVGEYWTSRNGAPARARYHYQYALFSAEGYTGPAQRYAYAQDVYLISLRKSKFIQPVLEEIRQLDAAFFGAEYDNKIIIDLSEFRKLVREDFRRNTSFEHMVFLTRIIKNIVPRSISTEARHSLIGSISNIRDKTQRIDNAVVAMISKQFPIFLVPDERTNLQEIACSTEPYEIRISREESNWYVSSNPDSRSKFRFSFDIPERLFELYKNQGLLSRERENDIAPERTSYIETLFTVETEPRLVRFRLNETWLEDLNKALVRH